MWFVYTGTHLFENHFIDTCLLFPPVPFVVGNSFIRTACQDVEKLQQHPEPTPYPELTSVRCWWLGRCVKAREEQSRQQSGKCPPIWNCLKVCSVIIQTSCSLSRFLIYTSYFSHNLALSMHQLQQGVVRIIKKKSSRTHKNHIWKSTLREYEDLPIACTLGNLCLIVNHLDQISTYCLYFASLWTS